MMLQVEQMLCGCLSADNATRKQAEAALNSGLEQNPTGAASGFMKVICESQNVPARNMATVLLRKKFVQNAERFQKLGPEFRKQCRHQLLVRFTAETDKKTQHHLCDLIVEIATFSLPEWPDLLGFLVKAVSSNQKIASALYVLGDLVTNLHKDMSQQDLSQMIQLAGSAFDNPALEVQLEALKCFGKIVIFADDLNPYRMVVDKLLTLLSSQIQSGDTLNSQAVLQVFVDIAQEKAEFFQGKLEALSDIMGKLAMSNELDEDVRMLALEVLVSVLEKAPQLCRKNQPYLQLLTKISLQMMLVVEDDRDEWNEQYSNNVDESPCFDAGQVALNRMAEMINTKKFLPILMPNIEQLFGQQQWTCKHAAIIAVAQTCELLADKQQYKEEIIGRIINLAQDPHHRVRYAAIHCLGIMCSDFGKKFVNKWHNQVLECFLHGMDDTNNPRLQANAAICVVNLAEKVPTKLLRPNLEKLLHKLFTLLNQNNIKKYVQENALTAIAEIAENAEAEFKKFYGTFVTPLIGILRNATNADYLDLRLEALRCLSYIGVAVGPEMFGKEAVTAMEISIPIIKTDGVEVMRILNSWRRIFRTMQDDAAKFLPAVAEVVFALASQEVKLKAGEWDSDDENVDYNERDIPVNATRVEEKVSAINLIYSMAKYSHGAFAPLIEKSAQIILPLIEEPVDDTIQEAAAEACPGMVECLWDQYKKNQQPPLNIVQLLHSTILKKVINQMPLEDSPDCLCAFAICIEKCIKLAPELTLQTCDENLLKDITGALLTCLKESAERMGTRHREMQKPDADEEDIDRLKQENEQESQLSTHISDAIGSLVSVYKERYLPYLSNSMDALAYMLGNQGLDIQKRAALYIFCDVIEHCPPASYQQMLEFLRTNFVSCAQNKDSAVRQAGLYGLGMLIEKIGSGAGLPLMEVVKLCFAQYKDPKLVEQEDQEDVQDNASMAVGRICKACPNDVPVAEIYREWVQCFPKNDDDCTRWVASEWIRLIETNNAAFMGPTADNLPLAVSAIAEICGTSMSSDEIDKRFCTLLQSIKNSAHSQKVFAVIPQDIQQKLMNL